MTIEENLFSIGDIARLCDTTNANICNWRRRDQRFPTPYAETSAGPIWKADDIVAYLKVKFGDQYDVISTGNLSSKQIAIVGRARLGKSFIISRFVEDRVGFVDLFCGDKDDKTVCPIHVHISEYNARDEYMFRSDFNSIYHDADEDPAIGELKKHVTALVSHTYGQTDKKAMAEIEEVVKAIREVEGKTPGRRRTNTYIATHQRPNRYFRELLRTCKVGKVEIIDTPGVSGSVEATKIAKSNLYIFVLKPENQEDAQTIRKIVEEIKSDVATSKVAFLYHRSGILLTQRKYDDARQKAHEAMLVYNHLFDDLKGSIVSADLDVFDPAKNCILFPEMDAEDESFPEEQFLSDLRSKIVSAFNDNELEQQEQMYLDVVKQHPEAAKEFTLKLLREIPAHNLEENSKSYTTDDVIKEKHDRVMTNDNYRLYNDLGIAYSKEAKLLDDYFSTFTALDYREEWQQVIIKYVHAVLTSNIRTDYGLGVSSHPLEDPRSRTMLIEESLFADSVLAHIAHQSAQSRNEPYRQALKSNGITSSSWNYVGCTNSDDAVMKLEIVKSCCLDTTVSSRQNMVLCRYIGGLRKVAEYKLLLLLGYTVEDAMSEVRQLPF